MRLILITMTSITAFSLQGQNEAPTNKHFWHSIETTASADEIWSVWIDVENWKDWDSGLSDASMDTAFKLGSKGTIISLEGRKSKFVVSEFIPNKSYTIQTKLPLGSLFVKRYLETKEEKKIFTHEVWFSGVSKGIFARAFGRKFREMLPDVLLNIKEIVENNDGN